MESIAKHIVEPNQLQSVDEALLAKSRLCGKESNGARISSTYYVLDAQSLLCFAGFAIQLPSQQVL